MPRYYFEIACAAIAEMYRQVLDPVMDPDTGLMQRGMIVRHLLLPGTSERLQEDPAVSP